MLITLLVALVVIGLLYWLITLLPLPQPIRLAAICVLVLIAIIWILQASGVAPHLR